MRSQMPFVQSRSMFSRLHVAHDAEPIYAQSAAADDAEPIYVQ